MSKAGVDGLLEDLSLLTLETQKLNGKGASDRVVRLRVIYFFIECAAYIPYQVAIQYLLTFSICVWNKQQPFSQLLKKNLC